MSFLYLGIRGLGNDGLAVLAKRALGEIDIGPSARGRHILTGAFRPLFQTLQFLPEGRNGRRCEQHFAQRLALQPTSYIRR